MFRIVLAAYFFNLVIIASSRLLLSSLRFPSITDCISEDEIEGIEGF